MAAKTKQPDCSKRTIANYSRFLGISQRNTKEWVDKLFGPGERPEVWELTAAYCKHMSEGAAGRGKKEHSNGVDPQLEKALLDRARRKELERKASVELRQLIPADEVDRANAIVDLAIRSAVFGVPPEVADELMGETSKRKIIQLITERLNATLEAINPDS